MSFNFSAFTKDLKSLGDKVTSEFNNELLPFAQRTSRMVQERIGKVNVDDISQLPSEYTELAAQCNNIERLYKNVLKITGTYETEGYDYPTNVQESFTEFGQNLTSRVQSLSRATTPAEAQAALLSGTALGGSGSAGAGGEFKPPKTFYHALARATDGSVLDAQASQRDDPLVKCLDQYSSTITKIANARLGQDQLVATKFNKPLTTTLRSLISQSNSIQKKVDAKRLDYDLARLNLANCSSPAKEPQLRVVMEAAEDDFANTVEDAINIMQNVLDNAKPLEEFLELVKAQLAYHKLAAELLGGLASDFEALVEDKAKKDGSASSARESGDFDI
ncbi:hypothetical protein CAAN1_13S02872 [[Candida] anglica]|uniref:BAR domain-containing protein n=1 Tax=[Candida] anglica TaxID=148631 RepID=A0ABP0EG78_9ASCO